jgi:metal-dependent amidase/aminoacylase/carboxypeptidase family protein
MALGASVEIETLPGYMPMRNDATMTEYYKANAIGLVGADGYREIPHGTGSTDMGDLSMVMPIIQPYIGGSSGSAHGADYKIADPELSYVTQAKALAAMALDMPDDEATILELPAQHCAARVIPRVKVLRAV